MTLATITVDEITADEVTLNRGKSTSLYIPHRKPVRGYLPRLEMARP